jgi:hypothetical protein
MSNPDEEVEDVIGDDLPPAVKRNGLRSRLLDPINKVHDNWISVPTWGRYMRTLGLHTRPVQKVIERSWARRAS